MNEKWSNTWKRGKQIVPAGDKAESNSVATMDVDEDPETVQPQRLAPNSTRVQTKSKKRIKERVRNSKQGDPILEVLNFKY
jgi:hypothetical protein